MKHGGHKYCQPVNVITASAAVDSVGHGIGRTARYTFAYSCQRGDSIRSSE